MELMEVVKDSEKSTTVMYTQLGKKQTTRSAYGKARGKLRALRSADSTMPNAFMSFRQHKYNQED
jgi:hypothetical protein